MTNAQPYQPAAPATDRYNVLAIVGFILAFVVNIAGLVVSIIALGQVKRTGERGRGLALAGVIISAISLLFSVISIIVVIVAAGSAGMSSGY
ncbi:DUF4190 domain-containing protein [Curtobacterium sp. MCSS17_008]|uniref:DUF4190 domain-containing protein n=1 Tax=Curtobacterium sp. MCSS17_008 TaxID=2175647 RepID=UPI000DA92FB2|nr:DUF4190 domain-containing protein [Curtobacterium sp. MCSS17_008]PZF58943.1 DUF4190 domain-containing protein [Curtobacterium sp. MCSS17_008]